MATVITWVFQSCCCWKSCLCTSLVVNGRVSKIFVTDCRTNPHWDLCYLYLYLLPKLLLFSPFCRQKNLLKKTCHKCTEESSQVPLEKDRAAVDYKSSNFSCHHPKAKKTICPSIQFLCDRNPDDKLKKSWRLINCKCDTLAQVQFELGPFHHTTLCLVMIFLQQKKFLNSFLVFATTWKCFTSF